MRLCALRVLILLCFLPPAAGLADQADTDFKLLPFNAEYRLTRDTTLFGRVKLSLERDGAHGYSYRARTVPAGLLSVFRDEEITESSDGRIDARGIVPHRYRYVRQQDDSHQVTELDFRWESMRVSNRTDGSHWAMSIPEGTQDKLGLQLALMMDLAHGRRFNTYPVADGGRLKQYQFRMTGIQTIKTIFGPLKTLRVSRSKQDKAPDAVFWFAPGLNHIPVRIDRQRKDAHFRMELDKVEGLAFSKNH